MAGSGYLREPAQGPIHFATNASSLLEMVHSAINTFRNVQDKISRIDLDDASFSTIVLPLSYAEGAYSDVVRVAAFMKSVSQDAAVREASREAIRAINDFEIESATREDIFVLMRHVESQQSQAPLDDESKYYLEKKLRRFIQTGLGISTGPDRERFKEIQRRLSALSTECTKNFSSEKSGLWLAPADLDGLPLNTLAGLNKGEGNNEGKLWLSMKPPDYNAALKFVNDPEIRKQVFLTFENRCYMNSPLLKEIVVLRDEAARLLGYRHHADATVRDRMAGSPDFVTAFLSDLRSRLTPASKAEMEKLAILKKCRSEEATSDSEGDEQLYLWDTAYYARVLMEAEFAFDQDKISEYFPLDICLPSMLETFEYLLGLQFEAAEVTETISLWHPEVREYRLWDNDRTHQFLGYLYFDLHPRDDKHGHNSHFNLQPGYSRSDGSRHCPSSALVCNFTKPLADKPSLLKHHECVTLFHELGHAIHSLVSQTRFSANHGTSVVRDFVEAPSKMLENWYWLPDRLKAISHHYGHLDSRFMEAWKKQQQSEHSLQSAPPPPAKMPDTMVNSIINARFVNVATNQLRQVFLALFDWTIHSPTSRHEIKSLDLQKLYNRMRCEITAIPGPDTNYDWGNGQARFSHMWGAYDAGYYGYLLAFSYACDMFETIFASDPMDKSMGRKYRYELLEKGGGQKETATLENFLGRKPNNKAMMKRLFGGQETKNALL